MSLLLRLRGGASVRIGQLNWTELELPAAVAARVGRVTWTELEVPSAVTGRVGRVTWIQFETPPAGGGTGIAVLIFNQLTKARVPGLTKMNYNLTDLGGGLYEVEAYYSLTADRHDGLRYEGYEFP